MSNERGSAEEELCVIFEEAVAWIANRSFSGAPAFGPRPLGQLPFNDEDDDEYCIELGSRKLAELLLVDYAAKGRVRIYARDGDMNNDGTNDLLKFPVKLASNSLSRAILSGGGEGYILMVGDEEYNYLAVHYDDLIREFWGDIAPITTREADVRTTPGAVPLRRRGRRPRYPWPDFAAELVRRSISGPPIANQAALEEHMLEWCHATWGAEPAASEIREWVRPTFQMLFRSSAAVRAPTNGMAGKGNGSPGIAEQPGE
jgi:hypothetical protein